MGHGSYSSVSRLVRADSLGYTTAPAATIFSSKSMNNAMSPMGVKIRESRDSEEHPNSVAIILALDVTGSMGSVPHYLVKEGLPKIVQSIIDRGIADPQILFLGIGDHEFDRAPLQVSQFESSDELLDKWLVDLWMEAGGGNHAGESYHAAWYFGANHTAIDCFEKRNEKGFLITVGDEPVLETFPKETLKQIMGPGQYQDFTAEQLLDRAQQMYHVFHINIGETASGSRPEVVAGWKKLLGDNLYDVPKKESVAEIISGIVVNGVSPRVRRIIMGGSVDSED